MNRTAHSTAVRGLDKDALYAGFCDGKTNGQLAIQLGCHTSTVNYHRAKWVEAGKPDPRTPQVEASQEAPVLPDEDPAGQPADAAEPVPPVMAEAQQDDTDNPPATAEQLQALADQFNQGQMPAVLTTANPRPVLPPVQPQPRWQVRTHKVYEGYILVDLVELADSKGQSPRGKVSLEETGVPKDHWWEAFREGDLVNVRVISVVEDWKRRDGLKIDLSIRQAGPHPQGRKWEPEFKEPEFREHPTEPTPPASMPSTAAAPTPLPTPAPVLDVLPVTTSLCNTCIKQDICPLVELFNNEIEPEPEQKPGRLSAIEITYGPRQVTRCSAFVGTEKVS